MDSYIPIQKYLELVAVILIISILVILFYYTGIKEAFNRAEVTKGAGKAFIEAKTDSMVFYALNGRWPENTKEALAMNNHENYQDYNLKDLHIEKAAINLSFNNGKILTLRPGSPDGKNHDFISWFANQPLMGNNFTIFGEDRTTIKQNYIPKYSR